MKRTQLYLDERLLDVLKVQARISKSTVSDVVTQVLREKYLSPRRIEILKSMVGLWKDRNDIEDSTEYVRKLRRNRRSEGIPHEVRSR
jgi:hypothetical protein